MDVWGAPIGHAVGWGWIWTIHDDQIDPDEDDKTTIRVPRDMTVPDEITGRGSAAWRPETISRALEGWAASYADRPDLRFEADPTLVTPLALLLDERTLDTGRNPKRYPALMFPWIVEDVDARTLEAVRNLPQDAVVAWHDDIAYRDGLYVGNIDVWAPAICKPAGLHRAWDVSDDARECECPEGMGTVLVIPRETTIDQRPAWHPGTISLALEAWAADHAGRSDLRFTHDTTLITPLGSCAAERDRGDE